VSISKPRITIVGLGQVGVSLGLALRQSGAASSITGHDRERGAADQAKRQGAVDRVHWNLLAACEEADFVILALPLDAIEETLQAIAPELRAGCVVMDTASVKVPVLAWAEEILPQEVHFVGGNPIPGGVAVDGPAASAAGADLFRGGLFCIIPSPGTDAEAVKLVSDMVSILGAKPLFLDAVEHDGLMAAVDELPALLSLALMETMARQPAWRELRKVAGRRFEVGTRLGSGASAGEVEAYLVNRENLLRWIDAFSAGLGSLRQAIAEGDFESLAARAVEAHEARQEWLADWTDGKWFEGPQIDMPERGSIIDSFFGTFWRRRPGEKS
jgi:prephenate dehydrogenase